MENSPEQPSALREIHCAECGVVLTEGQDMEKTADAVFCRPCFDTLQRQLDEVLAAQATDIPYPKALIGGLIGGVLGIVVWWGFTATTEIAIGLVAVVIGFTVGKGINLLSGDKRHLNLQIMSALIAAVAFFIATYLVNRSFIKNATLENGEVLVLPLVPGPEMFVRVISLDFNFMDLIFLAIVIYEAWKIPAPFKLAR